MNAAPSVPEPVRAEAERWFGLMMAPDCPSERLVAFRQWLQAAPSHREAYLQVERLWERLGEAVQRPGVRALPEAAPPGVPSATPSLATLEFRPRERASAARPWLQWGAALAACLVLAVGGVFVYDSRSQEQLFQTAIGESRSLTLADGSMVTLDTDSRIAVAFDGRGRRVTLRQGTVFFDVAPDAARPFVVATPHGSATVLGTQFQVRHASQEVRVVLVKGALRLDTAGNAGEGVVLRPGQQAKRMAGGSWQVAVADPDSTAWRQGRLVFRATPLSQAVAEVNRYTAHKLRIGDPSLEALTVSGVFRTGDPDSFVLVLENSLPVRAQADGDEHLLLRRH